MTDEEWIDFQALDTENFAKRVKNDFGLELKIASENTQSSTAVIGE
jgi:hypothetical protein